MERYKAEYGAVTTLQAGVMRGVYGWMGGV